MYFFFKASPLLFNHFQTKEDLVAIENRADLYLNQTISPFSSVQSVLHVEQAVHTRNTQRTPVQINAGFLVPIRVPCCCSCYFVKDDDTQGIILAYCLPGTIILLS